MNFEIESIRLDIQNLILGENNAQEHQFLTLSEV